MPQDKDRVRIQHMLDAAERINAFTADVSKEQFQEDEKLNLAIIRLFEILGEAANNISDELHEEHNDIPWREIAGVRNRLIHGYFDVDLNIVWEIIKQDIPILISNLKYILK
jgi:uncharacterized protein with HEPN domain